MSGLPQDLQVRVTSLESLDTELGGLEAQFRKERRALERKFEALYAPVFARRAVIIGGEDQQEPVPNFWLGVMSNSSVVSANITQKDEAVLQCLSNITCTTLAEEQGVGFRLEFSFMPNAYFSNPALTKTYYMADSDAESVIQRAVGTEIRWKAGMNPSVRYLRKRSRSASGNRSCANPIVRPEPCESFFHFFRTPKLPLSLDPGSEAMHTFIEAIEADYEIGMAFKEKIVPHAVRWFTGEVEDDEEFEDDSDDEDNRWEEEWEEVGQAEAARFYDESTEAAAAMDAAVDAIVEERVNSQVT